MSFELKRVPLNFDWPLHFVWIGYVVSLEPPRPRIEPPKGIGFQIWETNKTQGSPVSPVFRTPHELADYMTNQSPGIDKNTTYAAWLFFIQHLKDDPDKLKRH